MSGRIERLTIAVLALAVALGFAVDPAHASKVTSKTTTNGNNTVVTYTVTAGAGETITDFHIQGPTPKTRGNVKGAGAGPAGWLNGKNSQGHWWRAGSTGASITAAGGPQAFTLTLPTSQFNDGLVAWVTTNDNNQNPGNGVVDSGPDEGEPSTHGPVTAVTTPTRDVLVGLVNVLPINSTEALSQYEYFAVGSDPATGPDAETDYADFVAWAQDNPVPPSWGLVFVNMAGVTDEGGDTFDPAVIVPADPGLAGTSFWLVAVVDSEDGGPEKFSNLEQRLITIVEDADAVPVTE